MDADPIELLRTLRDRLHAGAAAPDAAPEAGPTGRALDAALDVLAERGLGDRLAARFAELDRRDVLVHDARHPQAPWLLVRPDGTRARAAAAWTLGFDPARVVPDRATRRLLAAPLPGAAATALGAELAAWTPWEHASLALGAACGVLAPEPSWPDLRAVVESATPLGAALGAGLDARVRRGELERREGPERAVRAQR